MGFEFDLEHFLETAFWPLFWGSVAAFSFLTLLAHSHLRNRALVTLLRRAITLRQKQEEMKRRIGTAPLLARYQRLEKGIREILAREGLRSPALPVPPPTPAPGRPSVPAGR